MDSSHATYTKLVVEIAQREVGIREHSHNRGPEVDQYVWATGRQPSGRLPWCMAFVYWVHWKAALKMNARTTCPKTSGVMVSWKKASKTAALRFSPAHVTQGLVALCPGDQFVRVRMGQVQDVSAARAGRILPGHTGIITHVDGTTVQTIEGNTNDANPDTGDGVYSRDLDVHMPELVGYVRHTLTA